MPCWKIKTCARAHSEKKMDNLRLPINDPRLCWGELADPVLARFAALLSSRAPDATTEYSIYGSDFLRDNLLLYNQLERTRLGENGDFVVGGWSKNGSGSLFWFRTEVSGFSASKAPVLYFFAPSIPCQVAGSIYEDARAHELYVLDKESGTRHSLRSLLEPKLASRAARAMWAMLEN
jgi:hypothetical protein